MLREESDIFNARLLCVNTIDTLENHRSLGFLGRADTERVPFSLPFDWNADPLRDTNWMFLVSSWRVMDTAIVRYFETRDRALLEEIRDVALDWAAYHRRNKPNRFTWYNMAVGIRALRIAFLLDRSKRGELAPHPAIIELAHQHVRRLMDEPKVAINNHGIFQMTGLLALSSLTENPREVVSFAERKLGQIIEHAFTKDGISKEHSPAYHRFVHKSFAKFRPLYVNLPGLQKILRLAAGNEKWLTLPRGHFAAIGDTDNDTRGEILPNVQPNDIVHADGRPVAVKFFKDAGYVICRSLPGAVEEFALFVTGSYFSLAHKHADDLSFVYESRGEPIFVDGGKFSYDYSDDRKYFLSARSHSTVSVDEVDFAPDQLLRKGSSIKSVSLDKDYVQIVGWLTRPKLFSQRREIWFAPFKAIEVRDSLRAGTPRTFRSTLKFAPGIHLSLTGDGGALALTPHRQRLVIGANRPIEIRTGFYSPTYAAKVLCPEISISHTARETELVWTIRHAT